MPKPLSLLIPAIAALALALAGCAPTTPADGDSGRIQVVASTNVYGDLAATIGGDAVEVDLDHRPPRPGSARVRGQRPHPVGPLEGTVGHRERWRLRRLRRNDALGSRERRSDHHRCRRGLGLRCRRRRDSTSTSGSTSRPSARSSSTSSTSCHRSNPPAAAGFDANAQPLRDGLAALEAREAQIAESSGGAGVIITEPVPLYLLTASGLDNLTPPEFSEAVEEDTDAPPAVLAQVLDALDERLRRPRRLQRADRRPSDGCRARRR